MRILIRLGFVFLCCYWMKPSIASPLPFGGGAHEFHLSQCMINYDADASSLQITLHIFIDDLELALQEQGVEKQFVGTERETETADKYIERYLQQRLRLLVNQNSVTCTYLGKEVSDDLSAVWCYLEVSDITQLGALDVRYNLLMEIFDDQKNIINIKGPEEKQAYFLFVRGKSQEHIQF